MFRLIFLINLEIEFLVHPVDTMNFYPYLHPSLYPYLMPIHCVLSLRLSYAMDRQIDLCFAVALIQQDRQT